MAIANGTCVSFCNQPKAQFGYRTSRESCQYVIAFTRFAGGGIWLPQESKAHFGFPWDNRSKCHMDEKEDSMLVKRIAACRVVSSEISAEFFRKNNDTFPE